MRSWTKPLAWFLVVGLPSVSVAGPHHPRQGPKSEVGADHHQGLRLPASKPGMRRQHVTDVSGQIQKDNVSVAVQLLDPEQTKAVFGVELLRQGIQPLVIDIHNGSGKTYHFSKADVDARYIPAIQVAKHAYPNPVVTGIRTIVWLVWSIPVSLLESVKTAKELRPPMNQDIRADYVHAEIVDREIGPNSSLAGFLFIHPLTSGSQVRVKLINVQTQEPLLF